MIVLHLCCWEGHKEQTTQHNHRVTLPVFFPQVLQHQLYQKSLPPCLWNQNRSRTRKPALRRTRLPQGTRSRGRRSTRARRQQSRALGSTGGAGASPGLPGIWESPMVASPHCQLVWMQLFPISDFSLWGSALFQGVTAVTRGFCVATLSAVTTHCRTGGPSSPQAGCESSRRTFSKASSSDLGSWTVRRIKPFQWLNW